MVYSLEKLLWTALKSLYCTIVPSYGSNWKNSLYWCTEVLILEGSGAKGKEIEQFCCDMILVSDFFNVVEGFSCYGNITFFGSFEINILTRDIKTSVVVQDF